MIKQWIKKLLYGEKSSSEAFVEYLKKNGVKVGERTTIFSPTKVYIDIQRPWLLEIGSDVQITNGVTILTHGYDWSVLKHTYGDVLGSSRKVKIGNNVFIGMNTTILKGVEIGDNVIVGAGSLVNKDIPSNCVAAGNPAKVIMSLEEYYQKRKSKQVEEAKETAIEYYKRFYKVPTKEIMYEFFWLFEDRKQTTLDTPIYNRTMQLVGNEKESYEKFKKTTPVYTSYKEFLKDCGIEE